MEQPEQPYISPLVFHLLPDASQEERLAAQATLDDVISVLYRICDRLVREEKESTRDKTDVYARVNATEKNL